MEKDLRVFKSKWKNFKKSRKVICICSFKIWWRYIKSNLSSLMSKIDIYMAEFASYTAYFVPEILSLRG